MNSHVNRPSRGTHNVRTKTAGTVVAALLAGLSAAVACPLAFAQQKEEPALEKAGPPRAPRSTRPPPRVSSSLPRTW